MKEILELIKNTSVGLLLLAFLAYLLKILFEKSLEKSIDRIASRMADIGKASLDIKKSLRNEEREELLALRVAIEKWEDALQTLLFDFTMISPSEAQITPFYDKDKELFLEVKIAVVKVSTYLRDKELEIKLMAAINKIRQIYYPIISEIMPRLIDLQAKLIPLERKMKAFEQSGMKDLSLAPTPADRDEHLQIQKLMTSEMERFSTVLLKEYRSMAEQMSGLKENVNLYIYRPIEHVDINKD
ncbi:MAG: hypothetical protein ONB46_01330 [candidate division KSB1 bacterium]|nr:hypothetical protein [candidate division KSB1 bacterium]MDZ7364517.1 hypothetical protein [candidate division KSB1 bacterium]MDZ7405780.1 hypothetical protein [candidate division KSB1 bacterium]